MVEDIVDSGLTLSWLVGNLRSRGPASVRVCVDAAQAGARRGWTWTWPTSGFDIDNEFVIGYGLDYAERYRNLPFIGTLAPHVYGDEPPELVTRGWSSRAPGAPERGTGSAIRSVEVCETAR